MSDDSLSSMMPPLANDPLKAKALMEGVAAELRPDYVRGAVREIVNQYDPNGDYLVSRQELQPFADAMAESPEGQQLQQELFAKGLTAAQVDETILAMVGKNVASMIDTANHPEHYLNGVELQRVQARAKLRDAGSELTPEEHAKAERTLILAEPSMRLTSAVVSAVENDPELRKTIAQMSVEVTSPDFNRLSEEPVQPYSTDIRPLGIPPVETNKKQLKI